MPPRRRATVLEDRRGSLRAVLLLAVALFASAALQRTPSAEGARSVTARRSQELYVPALRAPTPVLARAQLQPGDGSNGARSPHPVALGATVATLGAPIALAVSIDDRAGTAATRRGALPSSRAPPLV
jgi:hypothetical protein